MNIELFQEITTEGALRQLEEAGLKYSGLYVDMNNKDERKYVKDNAQLINDLLKKLDRSRIDKTKAYKLSVEAEAKAIRERLEAANLPFSMLIDAYKHERAQILAAEKAKTEAAALVLQIEADHEHALLMDKVQASEAKEREQQRIVRDKKIADDAAEDALYNADQRQKAKDKAIELDRLKRESDKAHVSQVRTEAKLALIEAGCDEKHAKNIVKLIHLGHIPNVSISY